MLLSRQQLGAVAFCSADPSRVSLGHLRIDPDGTVYATDGYTLVRVIAKGNPAEDEFPQIDNIPAEAVSPTATVLLPMETARAVLAALKKVKSSRLPILGYALLRVHGGKLYLATTDLETPQVFAVRLPDCTFPDVENVLPGGKFGGAVSSEVPIGINADHLRRVADYRKLFEPLPPVVRVYPSGKTEPVLFEWEDGLGHEVLVLVMPIRL